MTLVNDSWSNTNLKFKPKIIGFICNWRPPTEAILTSTSRIQGYPKIRIVPITCLGRVDPAFVIRAFEMGADGVLVGGCHPDDCHYATGHLKVEKRIENTKRLLKLIGLGPERLRLERISASESEHALAQIVRDFADSLRKMEPNPLKAELIVNEPANNPVGTKRTIYETIKKMNVQYCLECGKCSSSCPISRVNDAYSPRRTVERFLLGFDNRILSSEELWTCLACYQCSERCPSDVRYPEFVRACRSIAPQEVMEGLCAHRGIPMALSRIMVNPKIEQDRMGWLPDGAEFSRRGDLLYLVGCLPYFGVVFEDFNLDFLKTAQSVVRILNRVGIKPTFLTNEKCCGHDLLWTGDFKNFEKLARINVANIKETGATRVVTACPECYRTIKKDYAEFLGNLDFEVLHISELLSELVSDGKLEFDANLETKVVYHDPCRLGRHMGVYEPPRRVITSLPGIELVEMERNRENAVCCGVNAWMSCDRFHKEVRMERLREAKNTGADLLVTNCPKCQIHWKCLASEKLSVNTDEITMEMRDLSMLVAEAMNLI